MAEMVAEKTKRINRKSAGRQVRLWVRAKFLGFRRYFLAYSDQKYNKTSTKPSLDWKVSMIELPLHTISERESSMYTKPPLAKRTKDSEYFFTNNQDNLGKNYHYPRKHRSRSRKIQY